MIYLFVIFFILELIVVTFLCSSIMTLDKKVNKLTEKFKRNRHTLKFKLRAVYDVSFRAKSWIKCQKRSFEKRRRQFLRGLFKGLLLSVAFLIFNKTKFKKSVLIIDLILVLYDTLRAGCKI